MKTVKIPEWMSPFKITINGVSYTYPAGETVEVEDFIAAAIKGTKVDPPAEPNNPSGVSSWNDLTDKPFGEEPTGGDTLTWDGNIEGYESIDPFGDGSVWLVKLSDAVVTKNDFTDSASMVTSDDRLSELDIAGIHQIFDEFGDGYCFIEGLLFFIPYDNYDLNGLILPKAGIWATKSPGAGHITSLTISGYTGFPVFKKLASEYLDLPGSAILYIDAEAYLYETSDTSDTTKRMTKAKLLEIADSGRTIYLEVPSDDSVVRQICMGITITPTFAMLSTPGNTAFTVEAPAP